MKIATLCFACLIATPALSQNSQTTSPGPLGTNKTTTTMNNGTTGTQTTTLSKPLGKSNYEVGGYANTTVTGGTSTDGSGNLTRSNAAGSTSDSSAGVAIKKTFP